MSDQKHKWYIVHTASNSEKKVKQSILENAERKNLSDIFEDIVVPVVEFLKIRRGKEVKADKKIMPGYVLIKMILTDDSFQLVKSIQQVSGFLGSGDKPMAISEAEVENILNQIRLTEESSQNAKHYEVGETVNIIDGPFSTFNGVVEEVDDARERLKVSVSIFGRSTPIDLNFSQVQKINKL
jgi:transcriptional antiterminator NusG